MTASLIMLLIQSLNAANQRLPEIPGPSFEALMAEYELIQQKQSKLFANQRRAVVAEVIRRRDL